MMNESHKTFSNFWKNWPTVLYCAGAQSVLWGSQGCTHLGLCSTILVSFLPLTALPFGCSVSCLRKARNGACNSASRRCEKIEVTLYYHIRTPWLMQWPVPSGSKTHRWEHLFSNLDPGLRALACEKIALSENRWLICFLRFELGRGSRDVWVRE